MNGPVTGYRNHGHLSQKWLCLPFCYKNGNACHFVTKMATPASKSPPRCMSHIDLHFEEEENVNFKLGPTIIGFKTANHPTESTQAWTL